MIANKHKIHNAALNFNFSALHPEEMDGSHFVDWAKEYVLEAIDHHADELTAPGDITEIDELRIDLDLDVGNDFFSENSSLKSEIGQQIHASIKNAITKHDNKTIPIQKRNAEIVLTFIQSGQVETYYESEKWHSCITSFFEAILNDEIFRERWLRAIKNINAFNRFFDLVETETLEQFIVEWIGDKKTTILTNVVMQLFKNNHDHFEIISRSEILYDILFALTTSDYEKKENLEEAFKTIIRKQLKQEKIYKQKLVIPDEIEELLSTLLVSTAIKKAFIKKPLDNAEKELRKAEDMIPDVLESGTHVSQAGIVLLAHFLPTFLERLGYLDDKGALVRQDEIPILFHYLATGETNTPEWKLTLPKILAGLKPGQHCKTEIKPYKKLDDQIQELLESIIEHWTALKNTSPEGLREAFLVREGALRHKNGFYFLDIEETTLDILLSFIPWNYLTIRLSWMKDIVFVEWKKE